jgi:hypothetical protein
MAGLLTQEVDRARPNVEIGYHLLPMRRGAMGTPPEAAIAARSSHAIIVWHHP